MEGNGARAKRQRAEKAEKEKAEREENKLLSTLDDDTITTLDGVDMTSLTEALERGGKGLDLKDGESAEAEGKIGWEIPWCLGDGTSKLTGHKMRHPQAATAMVCCIAALLSFYIGVESPFWSVTQVKDVIKDNEEPWDGRTYSRTYATIGIGLLNCEYAELITPLEGQSHPQSGIQSNAVGICTEFAILPYCPDMSRKAPELSYLV
jgi:hypothetical protein